MKKILIVDDQPEVKKLLEVILRGKDRQLLMAADGEEALSLARAECPQLILLDVMMPGGLDGYEVCRILKADPATREAAVIAMTAKVQEKDRLDAKAAGADDYIGKPFDLEALRTKVRLFLQEEPS